MANYKKDEVKETVNDKEQLLLTEAEFERRQRLKSKERINRITRVFGVFAILLLVFAGVFESFFEMTYFGALFTPEEHTMIWDAMCGHVSVPDIGAVRVAGPIFDDWIHLWSPWLAKLGITTMIIGVGILMVYFLTYTIVDLIDLVKTIITLGKDLSNDLSGNIKVTTGLDQKEKVEKTSYKKKKNLFEGDDVKDDEKIVKERPAKKRRSEKTNEDLTGLSPEQLDALLSGKPMEEVLGVSDTSEGENKQLF